MKPDVHIVSIAKIALIPKTKGETFGEADPAQVEAVRTLCDFSNEVPGRGSNGTRRRGCSRRGELNAAMEDKIGLRYQL